MHDGHRERMRKRLINGEKDNFYDHEILEMLLYATIPQRDTNPTAHELISEFGSFSAVLDANYEDLLKVKGIGVTSATLIKLLPLIASRYMSDKANSNGEYVHSDEDAFNYVLPKYINCKDEMSSALFLNNVGKILAWEKLSDGTVNLTEIPTRKIVSLGLKYNAAQVIIFHNHPSGIAVPSNSDVTTTKSMIDALKTIGIKLIDHLVIGGSDYVSMANSPEFSFLFQ